jgi:hypothetical protein
MGSKAKKSVFGQLKAETGTLLKGGYNFFSEIDKLKTTVLKDCRGFSYDQYGKVIDPQFEYPPVLFGDQVVSNKWQVVSRQILENNSL